MHELDRREASAADHTADLKTAEAPLSSADRHDFAALAIDDAIARDDLKARLFGSPRTLEWIGRYRILGILGAGGMGLVLRARDDALARTVALKLVRAGVAGDEPEVRARILRESQAMARLSHPNVVQIHDVGEVDGQVFVAMEYVRGQTLREWLDALDPALASGQRRREVLERFIAAGRGLAAAHAVGLIHRDFKPANVLVGDDGRVRVTDFGLARSAGDGASSAGPANVAMGSILVDSLTRTGAIVGTPAYMSPQQLSGEAIDVRSDIFSFTVALYEGLHGVRPYQAASAHELHQVILHGRIDPGDLTRAPPWLQAVLLRGLAFDPADRFPTMDALLDALGDDPEARRRRQRWLVLGLAVGLAIVVVLALVGDSLRARWRQHRLEEAAEQTIVDAERRIAGLRERGEEALATRLFEALTAAPALAETEALAALWLREGERRIAGGAKGDDGAVAAFARGYVAAVTTEHEEAALVGLARALHAEQRWDELTRLLKRLAQEHREALEAPSLAGLRLDSELAARDIPGALAIAADPHRTQILEGLSRGTPLLSRAPAPRVAAVRLGERGAVGYLVQAQSDGDTLVRVHRTLAAPPFATLLWPGTGLHVPRTTGVPLPYLVGRVAGRPESAVFRLRDDGGTDELVRWESGGWPLSAAALDLDGDGAPEIYVGEGPGSRDIVQVALRGDEGWQARRVGADVTMNSDVLALMPADLDGDGTTELIAGLGPWTAYDVRVLALDPARGVLHTRARDKLGTVTHLDVLERSDGARLLLALKSESYPNIRVFPRDRPHGDPGGIYFYRFDGAALTRAGTIGTEASRGIATARVVDVDGDGRADIVASTETSMQLLLQDAAGEFTPLTLGHTSLFGAFELDGDPAAELALGLLDYLDGAWQYRLWIAGLGNSPTPAATSPSTNTPEVVVGDAGLAEQAASADVLADVGLGLEAARSHERLAALARDPEDRARLELRAAQLHELVASDADTTARFVAAAGHRSTVVEAIEGALRGAMNEDQRRAVMTALDQAAVDAEGAVAERLARLREQLTALGGVELALGFEGPLPPEWSIEGPLALRRSGARRTLEVEAYGKTALMTLPVQYVGGPLRVELDATIERLEWSGELTIRLMPAGGGPSLIELRICAVGGGGLVEHYVLAWVRSEGIHSSRPSLARRLEAGEHVHEVLGCGISPGDETARCSVIEDGSPPIVWGMTLPGPPPLPGDYLLEVSTQGDSLAAVEAAIHGIRTTGLRPHEVAGARPPADQLARALVDGELAEVLGGQGAAPSTWSDAGRVELLLRLGRHEQARALLGALLGRSPGESAPTEVLAGLRRRPDLYRPVLAAIDERRVFAHIRDAWSLARHAHPDDPRIDRELEDSLVDLDRFVDPLETGGAERSAEIDVAVDLLCWRATLRARRGVRADARRDLRRALELGRREVGSAATQRRRVEQWIQLELAELAAADGDLADARDALRAAAELGPPELVADVIAARPVLRALAGRE